MIPFPKKKYNIIYADPPWRFVGWAKETKDGKKSGNKSPANHYKVQSMDWIKNLPIQNISDDNCILFLWVTFPVLKDAFTVIESWGFNYSTCGFVWVKTKKIAAFYFFCVFLCYISSHSFGY